MARATSSLPVPDSPVISTVRSLRAAVAIWQSRVFMTGEFPTMPLFLKGSSAIPNCFSITVVLILFDRCASSRKTLPHALLHYPIALARSRFETRAVQNCDRAVLVTNRSPVLQCFGNAAHVGTVRSKHVGNDFVC